MTTNKREWEDRWEENEKLIESEVINSGYVDAFLENGNLKNGSPEAEANNRRKAFIRKVEDEAVRRERERIREIIGNKDKLIRLLHEESEIGQWFGDVYDTRIDAPVEMVQETFLKLLSQDITR